MTTESAVLTVGRLSALRLPTLRLPVLSRRQWLTTFVLVAMLALNLIAGFSLLGGPVSGGLGGKSSPDAVAEAAALPAEAPPAPEPLQFRDVPPEDAVAINAAVPLSTLPNPAAKPFVLRANGAADSARALECLTAAVYYEAATEPTDGQRAVAQVVLNRVRHPAYPKSVCGVVFQGHERATGCQFTFTCDGSLARAPHPGIWARARKVAEAALAGGVFKPVGWATHYHTNWVVPYWSSSLVKLANVGTHIFYRWTGGWGTAPAFRFGHAGAEPDLPKMARLMGRPVSEDPLAPVLVDAAGQALPAAVGPAAASLDSFQRAVVRRYEPAKREDIAKIIATQTPKAEAITSSYRWAMTGDTTTAREAPLGKQRQEEKAEAKPAPPKELEGVRKLGDPSNP